MRPAWPKRPYICPHGDIANSCAFDVASINVTGRCPRRIMGRRINSSHSTRATSRARLSRCAIRNRVDGVAFLRVPSFSARRLRRCATTRSLGCVTDLANQLLGIPIICCYGDCAYLIPTVLAQQTLHVCNSFSPLLGIQMVTSSSEVVRDVAFPGLRGWFRNRRNAYPIRIAIPAKKVLPFHRY